MRLVTHTRINQQCFDRGSAPSKKAWQRAIEQGHLQGKVGMGKVWIDIDDFLSRDVFDAATPPVKKEIDLLYD